jgi:hypothetical protein
MIWHDNDHCGRSVSDEGYLLTWVYNSHGPFYRAWAKRQDGQRRGKYLGSGYSRSDLESTCDKHHAGKTARETFCGTEVRA